MTITDSISKIPLFNGLPEGQISDLARIAVEETRAIGDLVFSEGDEARGFFVVLSGRIKIFKLSPEGKEHILHFIEPGDPFAEVAVFAGSGYPAYAEAIKESRLLFFPRNAFVSLIRNDPDLAMKMMAILSQRLKYFARVIEDLSLKEVPQRLAAYLLYLGRDRQDGEITLTISKGQLASLLGTIPETLSRILNKMAAKGLIEVSGRKVKLLKKDAISNLASGETL